MQKTRNLKLNKPEYGDVADVADLNANMDILDSEVANKAAASHTHNNGADLTNVNAAKLGGREPSAYALDRDLKTVAKTGNYNDLTNKPTTMPANGGNADTVDGKHASDFAAYSIISNGDFNSMVNPGLYTMRSCANAPSTEKNYYGLLVLKSDNGSYVEQMAFMEGTTKVYVRCLKNTSWSEWEEIGNKYAEKLRIFDVDGSTLKDTDGTNNLVAATPKKISEAEARITGFGTDKYWYNLGISNQTMKVPYSDMAIRALSFGSGAVPADTGMVRNVEGISENIMNDCAFPVSYVTRVSNTPFSPINGQQFHLIYLPSTHNWSDATLGKLAPNTGANCAQMNNGTKITIPTLDGCTVTVTAYSGQGNNKLTLSQNDKNITASGDVLSISAVKGDVLLTAVGNTYINSIEVIYD